MPKSKTTKLIIGGILIIFCLSAINALFYSIGYAFSFKTGTYIVTGDYMADLFKIALSYPKMRDLIQSGAVTFPTALAPLLEVYYKYVAYHGVEGLATGQLTHFHLPPLTTFFVLLLIDAFVLMGFIFPTLILLFLTFFLTIWVLKLSTLKTLDRYLLFVAIIFSYPFIFFLQRGNFIGFFSFIFTAFAVVGLSRGAIISSIILMAVAVNIRPNLLVFLPLFYFWPYRALSRPFALMILATVIFFIAEYFTNQSYQDYTLSHFLQGLEIYKVMYIIGDWGFGYNTSVYSLFKFAFKILDIRVSLERTLVIISIISAITMLFIIKMFNEGTMTKSAFVFLLTFVSLLGTPVLADYHLLIFVLPGIFALEECENSRNFENYPISLSGMTFITCCVMLCPLNYISYHGLYVLTLLKIPIALAMSILLVRHRDENVMI